MTPASLASPGDWTICGHSVGRIWFGVIIVMTVELGLIDPALGRNSFVIKSLVEDAKIATIFYGVLPFITPTFLRLLLIALPGLALGLPSKMWGRWPAHLPLLHRSL